MKLTIKNADLQGGLAHARRIVERRSTIPILANVLITASDRQIELKTTDLDREVKIPVPAEVGEPGAVTVPAAMLYDIIAKCDRAGQTLLECDKDDARLKLRQGRSRFQLHTLPAADFPALDANLNETNCKFSIGAKPLRRLLDKAEFALSTEQARYYLNGIYLHAAGENTLRAVATDGHRLAQVSTPMPDGGQAIPGVIVPHSTVTEILKLIAKSKDDDQIEFAVSSSKIVAMIGGITLTSKLVDGTFPEYGRVIPDGNDKLAMIDCAELRSAVDRVTTVSSERGRAVKMDFATGKLSLTVQDPDAGTSADELEIDYNSDPISIGFNSRYMLDILDHCDVEQIAMKLANASSPTIIEPTGNSDLRYVLMPMRVYQLTA